jgi:Phage late-transcription coactivator
MFGLRSWAEKIIMPTRDEILEFSYVIENMADDQRIPCMDAIVQYCEDVGMEVEVAATLISSHLKSRIREEAQAINLIKKTAKLPL